MEVTLQEILDKREQRVIRQKELLQQFGCPLISFTMNIAGPVKTSPLIQEGFALGQQLLEAQLKSAGISVRHREERSTRAGCEMLYAVAGDAEKAKQLCAELEDYLPIGRLFDLDVLDTDGNKLSRENYGRGMRTCLICGKPVYQCSRSRAHSVTQLQEKTRQLLQEALMEETARKLSALAQKALLYEVCVTPKPGLVDRDNSGSHGDMDIYSFLSSSAALGAYFHDCAVAGMETREKAPEETFSRIRFLGRTAEQTMFRATGGVNTHKGAVFTMGLLCAAAGRVPKHRRTQPEAVAKECAAMTRGLVEKDFAGLTEDLARTAGQKLYLKHGIAGIRAEAEAGFPAVLQFGLPVLEKGLEAGLSVDTAGSAALLAIAAESEDTNLIARSSRERQQQIKRELKVLLQTQSYPDRKTLEQLDDSFIRERLSPGGSADLLAAAWFLHFLKQS